jgi:hypothetical protein
MPAVSIQRSPGLFDRRSAATALFDQTTIYALAAIPPHSGRFELLRNPFRSFHIESVPGGVEHRSPPLSLQ